MERQVGGGISRRRVLAGSAWATPAVLIAVAAPAAGTGSVVVDDLTIISSSSVGVGWGSTPQSVGAQLSFYFAYDQQWADAGITVVPATLTITAVRTDVDPNQTFTNSMPVTITQAGDSEQIVIEDVPPGTYEISYSIVAEPVVGSDGLTYQLEDAGGGPASVVVPAP